MGPAANDLPQGMGQVHNTVVVFLTSPPKGVLIPSVTASGNAIGISSRTTLEHIGQFIIQYCEASTNDIYKLRLFSLSLSGAAFTWFISLPPNSVFTFTDLEQKFHDYSLVVKLN